MHPVACLNAEILPLGDACGGELSGGDIQQAGGQPASRRPLRKGIPAEGQRIGAL
ncbi:hypothetical protein D3C75_1217110 [compost metagenome]